MKYLPSLLSAAFLALLLAAAGCDPDDNLRRLPNDPPVAIALFDNGEENSAEQRLGYVIKDETATLDGSQSFDPDNTGDPTALTFVWTFDSMPEDSLLTDEDIRIPEDDPDTNEVNEGAWAMFEPDALGTFRVRLVVLDDEEDPSEPSMVNVVSSPPSSLTIQLDWEATQADLDLHLIGPGGVYFGESDCFSWNPNPDWGDTGLATDNPELNEDGDGEGLGPYREVISLSTPLDGDYDVWVHYYSDHSLTLNHSAVTATPTIEVRVFNALVWGSSFPTPTPSSPLLAGDVWKVGVLSWPDRNWAPLNQISNHASENGPAYNGDDGSGDGSG